MCFRAGASQMLLRPHQPQRYWLRPPGHHLASKPRSGKRIGCKGPGALTVPEHVLKLCSSLARHLGYSLTLFLRCKNGASLGLPRCH